MTHENSDRYHDGGGRNKHARVTEYGNLGCAASVSSVLQDAGVARVDEVGVRALAANLKGKGWDQVPFGQRQPGDVIIAIGYPHGHTGVVGEHRDVTYNNHSTSRVWSKDPASFWTRGKWPTVYCLRAPERNT